MADSLVASVGDLYLRRHELTKAEWLEAAPVLLGMLAAQHPGLALDLDAIPKDGTHVLVKRVVFRHNSQKGYYEPCGDKWEECLCRKDGYWQPYEGSNNGHPLNTTDTFGSEIIREWKPLL